MLNPEAAVSGARPADFADAPVYLDLDGGGIRAMAYDPQLGGFLILSRQQKKGEAFKLWLWDGGNNQPPRRVRVNADLSKAEGVAPVRLNGTAQIMIVFDNSKRSGVRNAEYLPLSYGQLNVDPAR